MKFEFSQNRNFFIFIFKSFIFIQCIVFAFTLYQKIDYFSSLKLISHELSLVDLYNVFIYSLLFFTALLYLVLNIKNMNEEKVGRALILNIQRKQLYKNKKLLMLFSLLILMGLYFFIYIQWLIIAVYSYVPSFQQMWTGNSYYSIHESIINLKTSVYILSAYLLITTTLILVYDHYVLVKRMNKYEKSTNNLYLYITLLLFLIGIRMLIIVINALWMVIILLILFLIINIIYLVLNFNLVKRVEL